MCIRDRVKIDAMTGLLPNIDTEKEIYEAFVKGTAPLTNNLYYYISAYSAQIYS